MLSVKPAAAVMVNSKYFAVSILPPAAPPSVEPVPQLVARELFELPEVVTPFFVRLPTVRFEMADPLKASEVVFPVALANE